MSPANGKPKRLELGDYLRDILLRNRLKQSDLARYLGVSRQYVGLLANGKTAMSAEHFKQIRSWFFKQKLPSSEIDSFIQLYIESKINLKQDLPPTSEDIYQVVLELKKYVNQELVLNRCLELATADSDYEQAILQILPTVAEAVNCEHCCVYAYDEHCTFAQIVFEWNRQSGAGCWLPLRRTAALPDSPWRKQLLQHKIIHAESKGTVAAKIPESCRKSYFASSFKSLLISGIWRHQKMFGILVLANRNEVSHFTDHDERLCQSASRIIQLLLERG